MAKWPSDKELEEIYRKGSENHNFKYDPSAWDDMTVLLDKKDNRKVIFFILFGIIFLSLSGIFFTSVGSSDKLMLEEITSLKANSNSILDNKSVESTIVNIAESLKGQNTNIENSNNLLNTENKLQVNNQNDLVEDITKTPSSHNNSNEISDLDKDLLDFAPSLENNSIKSKPLIVLKNQFADNESNNLTKSDIDLGKSKTIQNLLTLPTTGLSQLVTNGYLILPKLDSLALPINVVKKKMSFLSLVGIIGAESSWTPTGEFSSIDYSIGLGLNVQLRKKLGFTIGVSYIRDLYIANKGDYKAKQEFWRQTEEPNYTSANCKMIELNTGLSYYFNGWENDGIGIQIGLLSNFMLSEQYDYHFEVEDMNFSSSWTGSNKTWLNAIDISPIYRFSYGKNGNIEISPYFKIPLNGIGHGDVLLSSFGLKGRIRIL